MNAKDFFTNWREHNPHTYNEKEVMKEISDYVGEDYFNEICNEFKQAITDEIRKTLHNNGDLADYGHPDKLEQYITDKVHWVVDTFGYFDKTEDYYKQFIVELLHDVCGYLGTNLNDSDFEKLHGWVDENVDIEEMFDFISDMLNEFPYTEQEAVLKEISSATGIPYETLIGKEDIIIFDDVVPTDWDGVKDNKFDKYDFKQLCDVSISRDITELVYNIINTSNYDGDMGVIIVKGVTPHILKNYGFDDAECKEIGTLKVGETFTSHVYGNGCVVVRMA